MPKIKQVKIKNYKKNVLLVDINCIISRKFEDLQAEIAEKR